MNAFPPGGNADFGDPELINLFLGGILGRPGRAYTGKKLLGGISVRPGRFVFPPIRFPRGEMRSYAH